MVINMEIEPDIYQVLCLNTLNLIMLIYCVARVKPTFCPVIWYAKWYVKVYACVIHGY